MTARDLLLCLSIKYKGDFKKMLNAIQNKETATEEQLKEANESLKTKFITILDQEYPTELKTVTMPPLVLYYIGDISLLKSEEIHVAVIGSREYSPYGEKVTKLFVEPLAKNKRVIVSGMARGIDSIAHETCINAGGKTIAVLGNGILKAYPSSNQKLYDEIKKNHLVISEYPGELEATPENFPMRNRIVAGISNKILVTEGHVNSGTNITVLFALKQGKDILAVPSEIGKQSACNKLIQDGAYLVETVDDVLYLTSKKY